MKINKLKMGALGILAMSSMAPAVQAEEAASGPFSAGVAVTSDYRFRGISQSDRNPALQGWIQYDHASGFFGNVWLSTIDFNDSATYDSGVEADLTAGYNFKLGENTGATVKAVYYWYADADTPAGAPDQDYWELIASASHSYGKLGVSAELAYSPDFFAESGDAWALTGGASYPITDSFLFFTGGVEAGAHVGHQWLDGDGDYMYYDIGLSASVNQFSLGVSWVDTDISKANCFGGLDWCEGGVVVTLSADLPG